MNSICIRKEDKNEWERRTPLNPDDAIYLHNNGVSVKVESSDLRIYGDEKYSEGGLEVFSGDREHDVVIGVKEVPLENIRRNAFYINFSHTIKGQDYNMPSLKRYMEFGSTLIDYERIVDENCRRQIFFGRYAGIAGMIETLNAFGKKKKLKGEETFFSKLEQPYRYAETEKAYSVIKKLLSEDGMEESVVIGITGYGNVSKGAQEVIRQFPNKKISAEDLLQLDRTKLEKGKVYYCVFKEVDMFARIEGSFELHEYFSKPELYRSKFAQYLMRMDILVNCIYWTEEYPRLITKEMISEQPELFENLSVIGDISCDIDGSVEITHKATLPDEPNFTYAGGKFEDGVKADGITVMAVDNLPCEFSKEASDDFSKVLKRFIPYLSKADLDRPFEEVALPPELIRATIVYKGELTPDYEYLKEFIS